MLKLLDPRMALLDWSKASWEVVMSWGVALERNYGVWGPSSLFLLPGPEGSSDFVPPWTEISKIISQNKPFLIPVSSILLQ